MGADIRFITGDSGYSSTANLKTVRNHGIGFMLGIDSHRKVSFEKLVFASQVETFGNVVLEAMVSDLPVIAYDAVCAGQHVRDGYPVG